MSARARGVPARRERGVALITAVLVVAIAASAAAFLAFSQEVWLRQVQHLRDAAQAEAVTQGAIDVTALLIAKDDPKVDDLNEAWATTKPVFPVEGGSVEIALSDPQGRFNLNNLLRNGQPSPGDMRVFQRLLALAGLNGNLADALLDWMDPDDVVRPGGAEDSDYLALTPPYRAANRPLDSVDELRLVRGFDAQAVDKLRPWVTVLPQPTAINVNTAPAAVLSALFPAVSLQAAEEIVRARANQPFTDPAALLRQVPPGQVPETGYDVKTGYFEVNVLTVFGRLAQRSRALLARTANGKAASVVWYSRVFNVAKSASP